MEYELSDARGLAAIANTNMVPAESEVDNHWRAASAARMLKPFADELGFTADCEDIDTVMIDALANMMHLARQLGMDKFSDIISMATMHYESETGEES
jgi:hypothetical protein